MELPPGTAEVDALMRLAEEAETIRCDPLQALFADIGIDGGSSKLPAPEKLQDFVSAEQFVHFLETLKWPQATCIRNDFARFLMVSKPPALESSAMEPDADLLGPMVPGCQVALTAIMASASSPEDGMHKAFWLVDRAQQGAISGESVLRLINDMAAVAASATTAFAVTEGNAAGGGKKTNSTSTLQMYKSRQWAVRGMLEKVLWTALDKLGVLRDGTTFENCRITGEMFLNLGDQMAEELFLQLLSEAEVDGDSRETSSNRSDPGVTSEQSQSSVPPGGSRCGIMPPMPRVSSALRVLRGGRPSAQHQHPSGDHKGAPDEPLKRPQASGEAGPKENKPRLGNERLWEGQVRPSLAEAKKAADAAAEAAAKEIMTKETESKPGWAETLSNALIGLGIEIGMRLFLVDSARALLMSSMVLTDVAIIAMLILQFDVPVALAIVSVVVINVLLAGIALLVAAKGVGACCCCITGSKKPPAADLQLSVFTQDMRPTMQKYLEIIQKSLMGTEEPNRLRDVDDEPDLELGESVRGGLEEIAREEATPRQSLEAQAEAQAGGVHQRAQSLWQIVGRVAGFEQPQPPQGQ